MTRLSGFRPATLLLAGFAVFAAGGTAQAGSTATRCDDKGCVHIHCNSTGDRCYRYVGDYESRHSADRCYDCENDESYSPRDEDAPPNLLCDSDGDRCYPSWRRRWNYREYYRRLGYHWGDEGSPE
jgi:hypothetical protein